MASVDSGVETGNDSNDSCVTHDGIVPHALASDRKAVVTGAIDVTSAGESGSTMDHDFRFPLFSFSSGTENKRNDITELYQRFDLQRKLRAVLCRVKTTRESWQNFKGPLYERKLRHACSTNHVDLVKILLNSGVNPNCFDVVYRSPLHLAACRGYADVVKLLLDKGANPNRKDSLGNTPLHLAACTNNLSVVTLLLKAGADVSSLDMFGRNPLQLAQARLKLLQRGSDNEDSKFIKGEVQKVIDMMMVYLQKKGQQMEMELLTAFASRVTLSSSKEEVQTDVRDLLASLNNLSLDGKN